MDLYEISKVNLGKEKYICFELFEVWALNFSLKEETMRNMTVKMCCYSAFCNSLLYAGFWYLVWQYRNFSLVFISFRTFKAIASPFNLANNVLYCFTLTEWPAKDILIFLTPIAFEKRMDLVFSFPKWIDGSIVYEPQA